MEPISNSEWAAAEESLRDENYIQEEGREEFIESLYRNLKESKTGLAKNTFKALVELGNLAGKDFSDRIFGLGVDFGMRLQELRTKENTIHTKPLKINLDA